ncbi:serine-type D-Ala-D-Ala carboxypeptidase, partial [Enterobacteriaceae bacterium ML5]
MTISSQFKRTFIYALGGGVMLLALPAAQADTAPVAPQVNAKSWVLMDYNSGKILAQSNPDARLDPASLSKIMVSYVVGQAIKSGKIKSDDLVSVGNDAWATGNPVLRGSSLMFL